MSTWQYVIGLILALTALATALVTPFFLAHLRTECDHGPDCWWCHPHFPHRQNRR